MQNQLNFQKIQTALLVVLVSCLFTFPVFSQSSHTGVLLDAQTGEPVAYASLGIPGTTYGTVSSPEGRFELMVPAEQTSDSVRIKALGYQTVKIALKDLADVRLTPEPHNLPEVLIRPGKTNKVTLGSDRTKTNMNVNLAINKKQNQNLGSEVGKVFKLKKPSSLGSFAFYIRYNNFDTVRFRVNVYALKKGEPDQLLSNETILVEVTGKKMDWIQVDLSPYNIECNEGKIAVSVEWVYGSKNGTVLALPIAMPVPGSTHLYKFGSQNNWKTFRTMSSSLELTVSQ